MKDWPWLLLLGIAYTVVVVAHWNRGYLDFGDGNYMYISWRMSQGAMLYRDVLAPQPPLHLVIGAGLARFGTALLPHPLYAFRAFSLLLHVATMLLVYATARRVVSGSYEPARTLRLMPLFAAAVYLLLPIGFWWTLGYQTQPLLIFLLLLTFFFLLKTGWKTAVAAGVTGALAVLTNMTAVPYVLLLGLYLLVRRPRQAFAYGFPLAALVVGVIATTEAVTGAYIDNVIRNQVGAFPRKELLPPGDSPWKYAVRKLQSQGREVLNLEAGWLLLAAAGMIRYSWRGLRIFRELPLWFSLASWGALVYVAKGGTMNYVFSLAEPYVAIFAGYSLAWGVTATSAAYLSRSRSSLLRDTSPVVAWISLVLAGAILVWFFRYGLVHNWQTLKQQTYELPEAETLRIVDRIRNNSKAGDVIFAPPYYAFLAQRRIAEDYSELFLWRLKYLNEKVDNQRGRATETVERLAARISRRELPFLLLDLDQTGALPKIKAAVERNYDPVQQPFRSLNTPLQFYRPRS